MQHLQSRQPAPCGPSVVPSTLAASHQVRTYSPESCLDTSALYSPMSHHLTATSHAFGLCLAAHTHSGWSRCLNASNFAVPTLSIAPASSTAAAPSGRAGVVFMHVPGKFLRTPLASCKVGIAASCGSTCSTWLSGTQRRSP